MEETSGICSTQQWSSRVPLAASVESALRNKEVTLGASVESALRNKEEMPISKEFRVLCASYVPSP